MTIIVHKLVGLPKNHAFSAFALPKGFPVVLIQEQCKILEHVLLFQIHSHLRSGTRNLVMNTALAQAYDLMDWFDFLQHLEWNDPEIGKKVLGKPWDLATEQDYIDWRDTLQELISSSTKQPLASKTIARRQGAVESIYKFAQAKGWYVGEFVVTKISKGRTGADVDSSYYREPTELAEPVRPMLSRNWRGIQAELGPLPSEQKDDGRPVRNRLASELSLTTGLRVDEVASLTELQLHGLNTDWLKADDSEREVGFFQLRVTKTKGLKPRDILVPGYLIVELMSYLDGERAIAISAGQKYAESKSKKFKTPSSLFVNHANAGRYAGLPISASSLSHGFKLACLKAGVTKLVRKVEFDSGDTYFEQSARHSFHDLRHTFAVWKYHDLVNKGEAEPWKEIQVLLGHAHLQTTIETYLKVVAVDRRTAGAAQFAEKSKLGNSNA
jgi:integrase/recombinase XerC